MTKFKSSLWLIMLLTILIVSCSPKEEKQVRKLISDKQTVTRETTQPEINSVDNLRKEAGTLPSPSSNVGDTAFSSHSADEIQKIVYSRLNSWTNTKDYYEIAFNSTLAKDLKEKNIGKYIKFTPDVAGVFSIMEDKKIVFKPETRFAGDTKYTIIIDQSKLFSEELPKVELTFKNPAPILRLGQVILQPTTKSNEYYLQFSLDHFRGRYLDDDYYQGLIIKVDNKKIPLDDIITENSNRLVFKSEVFAAKENTIFKISSDDKIFPDKANKVYYSNSVSEMRKFIVSRVSTTTDKQGKARIEIIFSKNLAQSQPLTGLIIIKDDSEITTKISKYANKVIVSGDFKLGHNYQVLIRKGTKAIDNSVIKDDVVKTVTTNNRSRQLEFVDKGIFLSSLQNNCLTIKDINYSKLEYQLWSIQVDNIAEMIHNLDIQNYSSTNQNYYYRNDNLHWYGQVIKEGKLETNVDKDMECFIDLDLGKIAKDDTEKIYILNISGLVEEDNLKLNQEGRYYYNNNRISKMIIFSDLAISAKVLGDKVLVHVNNVLDNSPVRKAEVELRSYTNSLLASGTTDRKGQLLLSNIEKPIKYDQFFLVARKRGEIAFLSSQAMELDQTKFNISKDYTQNELKVESFLDRDIYRPGEEVNLTTIIRDKNNDIIHHKLPLIIKIFDPQNVMISTDKILDISDGVANYKYQTKTSSNTGYWRIELEYAGQTNYLNFSLETFVPERINITQVSDKAKYGHQDKYVNFEITGKYLFGAPLANADCSISTRLKINYSFAQEKFSSYTFLNDLEKSELSLFNQDFSAKTNEEGLLVSNFKLADKNELSHPYFLQIKTKISEEGGRPIERETNLPISPRSSYIGLGNSRYLQAQAGEFSLPIVVVGEEGKKIQTNTKVEYQIYGQTGSWWWDYDYRFNPSYKQSETTQLIAQGNLLMKQDQVITFTPPNNDFNVFIVEVKIAGEEGYVFTRRYFNNFWADKSELTQDTSLELKTNQDVYQIGDKVKVKIPSSPESKLYISIAKKDKLIENEIISAPKEDYIYEFEATKDMAPNVYFSVQVVQGQEGKNNDLPLRLFGIIPISIVDQNTILDIDLDIPDKIHSNSKLKGSFTVSSRKKSQYLVSVVDQGLVNRSNYLIPNPWDKFYAQEGYYGRDFDSYSFFINGQSQNIFRSIMIGGGRFASLNEAEAGFDLMGMEKLQEMNRLQETGVQRFKPVSYFIGIEETDSQGRATFEIDVADYVGALNVTVVAMEGKSFGRVIKHTIVKDDIMTLPTLPRVLSPNDQIQIPVSVIIEPNITSPVEIELNTNEIIEITSSNKYQIDPKNKSELLIFNAKVLDNIGKAEFIFTINNREFSSQKKVDVGVRLPSTYETETEILSFTDEKIRYKVPELGYSQSSHSYLVFNRAFSFNADELVRNSIRYPYGGAVMRTANCLTQILLRDYVSDKNLQNKIDANVNSYFQDLVKFNRKGLWEWQGNWEYDNNRQILNAYALHTAHLARERGYNINDFINNEIVTYLSQEDMKSEEISFSDAYILYALAVSGHPDIATLNFYNEQETIKVENTAKKMLELAYRESGYEINDLSEDLDAQVIIQLNEDRNFLEPGDQINKALELYFNSLYHNQDAKQKANNQSTALAIAKDLQAFAYRNCYYKAWMLLGLTGYTSTLPTDYQNDEDATFELTLGNINEVITISDYYAKDISAYTNQDIYIRPISENSSSISISVLNTFVPRQETITDSSHNLNMYVSYTDLAGKKLDVASLIQGKSFYVEIETLAETDNMEYATSYLLPAGWEFAQTGNEYKQNRDYSMNTPNYVDVRDDRVIIYSTSRNRKPTVYKCKINAITKGKFNIPASRAEDIYNLNNKAVIKGKSVEVY